MDGVTIRRASPPDAQRLTALCHASSAYRGIYAAAIQRVRLTPGYITQHLVFTATDREDHLLAFYSLIRDPPELDMMFVADEVQGQGLGRLLLGHMSEQARAAGLAGVRVVSHLPPRPSTAAPARSAPVPCRPTPKDHLGPPRTLAPAHPAPQSPAPQPAPAPVMIISTSHTGHRVRRPACPILGNRKI